MKIKLSKSQWENIGKTAGWSPLDKNKILDDAFEMSDGKHRVEESKLSSTPKIKHPLPQDIKMNYAEIVNTVIQLMRQKRSDENIWEYFKIVYPNVELTEQHFNKARAILH